MRVLGRVALYLVLALSILLLFVAFDLKPELGDEGILAMDGWRISRGEVPQRDFFQLIPPLAAYVQAFCFKILAPSVFSIRILGLLYGILLLALSFLLYKKFIKSQLILALSLSIIVIDGVSSWEFGSHHWLCDILQVAGMILLLEAFKYRRIWLASLSGILLGFAVFALQDQGGYGVIALSLSCFFIPRDERRFFMIPAILAAGTFLLLSMPLALLAGPLQLFRDWVSFPLFYYKDSSGNRSSFSFVLEQFTQEWDWDTIKILPHYGLGHAVTSTFVLLTPVLAPLSIIFLWVKKVMPKKELAAVSIFSFTFLLTAFHRFSLSNMIWGFLAMLPVYISLDWLLTNTSRKFLKISIISLTSVLLAANLAYGIARAQISLRKGRINIARTSAGSYRFYDRFSAGSLQELVDEIDDKVPKDEPLFCVGYIPLVNFLTYHPNPTRLNFVTFGGYYSKDQAMLWTETLEAKRIVWGISEKKIMDEKSGKRHIPNYDAVFQNDRYILWKRKNAGVK
jgi:hypothetical protein